MGLRPFPAFVDTAALEAKADRAMDAAKAADDRAANAQQMVRNRDPRLATVEGRTEAIAEAQAQLETLAATLAQAIPAADETHEALFAQIGTVAQRVDEIERTPGPAGASAYEIARANGYGGTMTQWLASLKGADGQNGASIKGDKGDPGTPADITRVSALEAAVAALQALKVTVGFGVANLPASLAAGASTNVVVSLSRNMGSATYSVGYGLAGGSSLLGQLQATGVVAQTATTVTIGVRNTGLTALLNLSTASLSVVAARDAA